MLLETGSTIKPAILVGVPFGKDNRYFLTIFRTAAANIIYLVQDSARSQQGVPETIRQCDRFSDAIAGLNSPLDFGPVLDWGDKFIYDNHPYTYIGIQRGASLATGDVRLIDDFDETCRLE